MDPWPGPSAPAAIRRVISTKPAGSFRRTGWHSFEWSQPTSRGGVRRLQFKPGWVFCRVEDAESREVWWGVRQYNLSRIMRIQEDRVDGLQLALGEVLEESLAGDGVLSEATHTMLIRRHTSEGRGRDGFTLIEVLECVAAVALGMWLADVASSHFEGAARTVVLWTVRTGGSGILFVCFLFGFGYLFDQLEGRKTRTKSAGGDSENEV